MKPMRGFLLAGVALILFAFAAWSLDRPDNHSTVPPGVADVSDESIARAERCGALSDVQIGRRACSARTDPGDWGLTCIEFKRFMLLTLARHHIVHGGDGTALIYSSLNDSLLGSYSTSTKHFSIPE